jgi:hypothetical protein
MARMAAGMPLVGTNLIGIYLCTIHLFIIYRSVPSGNYFDHLKLSSPEACPAARQMLNV